MSGELVACAKCGQAVAGYRVSCPFCGEPTGRLAKPEGPETWWSCPGCVDSAGLSAAMDEIVGMLLGDW